jgi:hypothetical protein
MADLHVEIFSHHFACTRMTTRAREALNKFAGRYVEYKLEKIPRSNRWHKVADRVYAAATKDREEYRFHINLLKQFRDHLDFHYLRNELVEWTVAPFIQLPEVDMPLKDGITPRDYQEEAIEYINTPGIVNKLVEFQTGKGKSVTAMYAQYKRRRIGLLMIKPMYIEKWLIDLRKTFDLEVSDVIVAQGSAELMALLELAAQEVTPSYYWIIVSNVTFANWLKLYEEVAAEVLETGYACLPHQFYEHLKVGTRIIDEVHQDFHRNFKMDCYTHVENSVSLSATLISDDDFKNQMYEIAYPGHQRHKGPEYDKYIAWRAVFFSFKNPEKIRCSDYGSKRYSHNVFEQFILKNEQTTTNYFQLLNTIIRSTYIKDRKPGDKLIIFMASINMCTVFTKWLTREYPQLEVGRYVEEDPYEMLMNPDIRVTTLMSAGTAVDIPGLTHTLLTTAVKSSQSNVQGLGRLRKLPDGRTPVFITTNCQDIDKHVEYHNHRKNLMEPLCVSYRSDNIGILV